MTNITRRRFLGSAAALALTGLTHRLSFASPLGLPLGIQLYSVRQQMLENLDEALAAIRAAGYTEVEAAALPKKSAKEIRAALDQAGLRCVSAHHSFLDLQNHFDETVTYDQELGVAFIICASPGHRSPSPSGPPGGQRPLSLDDWRYNAEQFNTFGEKIVASGIRFGYHNHTPEFVVTEGKTPYVELLRLTDPKKVTFELDCGWVMVAGADPVAIMKDHPHRISMLHVKDFKLPPNPSPDNHDAKVTELGRGTVDYRPIFAEAARSQRIQHAFVEQESFDMPWKESLRVDADYMRAFKV
jgi:sugar phosphate isomerase/epimerase